MTVYATNLDATTWYFRNNNVPTDLYENVYGVVVTIIQRVDNS